MPPRKRRRLQPQFCHSMWPMADGMIRSIDARQNSDPTLLLQSKPIAFHVTDLLSMTAAAADFRQHLAVGFCPETLRVMKGRILRTVQQRECETVSTSSWTRLQCGPRSVYPRAACLPTSCELALLLCQTDGSDVHGKPCGFHPILHVGEINPRVCHEYLMPYHTCPHLASETREPLRCPEENG